jgi:DNA polymerase-1
MKTVLLFDGDLVAYRFASANEMAIEHPDEPGQWMVSADLEVAQANIREYIKDMCKRFEADEFAVALTHGDNFRKKIDPSYKAFRKKTRPPMLLKPLREWMMSRPTCKVKPGLEADDVLGIMSTNAALFPNSKKIVISIDKDLEQIPGWLFNPMKDQQPREINMLTANTAFATQVLTGDTSDGYKGLPGCGPKKAARILDGLQVGEEWWPRVRDAYSAAEMTEDYLLAQARLARILRVDDFNFKTQEPILWSPNA